LDTKYPGWFQSIDLATLDLADCHLCVMGQVYTGVIPAQERGQIIAQVVQGHADASRKSREYWADTISTWGGFSVLQEFYELPQYGRWHGFMAEADKDGESEADYAALLDEWTRVIISRRIQAHPDLNDLTCSLAELREPAVVG
jgi:hypothetical protein